MTLAREASPIRQQAWAAVRLRNSSVAKRCLLVGLGGLLVAGVVLRLTRLGERVLSFDEAYTVATSQRSFLDMLAAFRFEANGTLYAILLWPLAQVSEAEAVVRIPALIAGLATIPAVYWAGRELAGRDAGLVAAAFVAVSPAMIGWSVYGRGYPLAILFAVLSFGSLARAVRRDERRPGVWRGLYVLATLAMAYSSAVAAVTLVPVQALAIMTRGNPPGPHVLKAWGGAALGLLAGLLPLAGLLYVESTYRDPLAWLWKPDLALVRRVGGELTAGPAFLGNAGGGLTGAIVAALIAIALVGLVLSRPLAARPGWGMGVLVGWAFFPPLLLFVVSQVRPMFWGRYLGIVVPALALLVAVLLVRAPRALAVVCGAALATSLLVASLLTPAPHNDFRDLASWMEGQRSPADPIVIYPIEQLPPLAYYARTLRIDGNMPVEEWNDTPLPAGIVGYRRDYDWGNSPVGPPTAAELARLASPSGSILVLTYPNLTREIPVDWAQDRGCDVDWAQFDGLSAVSFGPCRAGD